MTKTPQDHKPEDAMGPNTTEGENLKPCPFCGTTEGLYPAHRGMGGGKPYAIDCVGCGIDFTPREGMDVATAWNRRSAAPTISPMGGEARSVQKALAYAKQYDYRLDHDEVKDLCARVLSALSAVSGEGEEGRDVLEAASRLRTIRHGVGYADTVMDAYGQQPEFQFYDDLAVVLNAVAPVASSLKGSDGGEVKA